MDIHVLLPDRSYPIVVRDSYRALPQLLSRLGLPRTGWVISHEQVLRRHGAGLLGPLRRAGWELEVLRVPAQERSKSFSMAQRVISQLARRPVMRIPLLIAFGGGVVGDLTGFVAATYRRGIPYIQVPTTLLAQVDSSIGGKVGVDLPQAKNLVGAFYQPRLVFNNLSVLRSLPVRQRQSGLAEVIKYGVMADRHLFTFIEGHVRPCLSLMPSAVRVLVECSARIKARIVSRDERETRGIRATLNFGHTVGHGLEAATGYRRFTHGEAIAIGMAVAADLAVELRLFAVADYERLVNLLMAAGLPVQATRVSQAAVLRAMQFDKKFIHGRPRWILPTRIGRVIVTEAVPPALVRRVLRRAIR